MIDEILKDIGLTAEEAEIYISLLKNGTQGASALAGSTKVKRTYVYNITESLAKRGLITKTIKGKATVFSPRSPDTLISLAQSQKERIDTSIKTLESMVNELQQHYLSSMDRPIVRIFEGVEGVKKIYEDTLTVAQEICAVLQVSEVEPDLRDWLKSTYVPKRAKLEIPARVILSSGELSSEYQTRQGTLRTVREVSAEKFPFQHEIQVYGDRVAFVQYKKGEPIIGLLITHPLISATMKAWFDLAWAGAEAEKNHYAAKTSGASADSV